MAYRTDRKCTFDLRRQHRLLSACIRAAGLGLVCCVALWLKSTAVSNNSMHLKEGQVARVLLGDAADTTGQHSDDIPAVEEDKCGLVINQQEDRCGYVQEHCLADGEGILNFTYFHYCTMEGYFDFSVACLTALVLLSFYLLGETAEEYFCPVVNRLTEVLDLAPNTAGVTFLAFGNGAPDVFSSLAAFLEGDGQIGIGAIVSAGSFVSAFVVGSVAIAAAPFGVYDGYVRDILFYLVATLLAFIIFQNGHIHVWEAAGLVFYYIVFVVYVVWRDRVKQTSKSRATPGLTQISTDAGASTSVVSPPGVKPRGMSEASLSSRPALKTPEQLEILGSNTVSPLLESPKPKTVMTLPSVVKSHVSGWWSEIQAMGPLEKIFTLIVEPFTLARRATIPDVNSYDRIAAAVNTLLCPLLILLFFNDFVDFDMPIGVFGEGTVPLWSVVLLQSFMLSLAQWNITEWTSMPAWMSHVFLGLSFMCSIAWISMLAQELLSCLSTLGHIMGLSPAIMGVTVLAWGNSVGDLVADVALARNGAPVVALAGCYAGPMFNMLIGLGLALVIKTSLMYPHPYGLHYDANVPVSFGFLFAALVSSILAVRLSDYRITKPWGWCLVGLYFTAMLTSVMVESSMIKL